MTLSVSIFSINIWSMKGNMCTNVYCVGWYATIPTKHMHIKENGFWTAVTVHERVTLPPYRAGPSNYVKRPKFHDTNVHFVVFVHVNNHNFIKVALKKHLVSPVLSFVIIVDVDQETGRDLGIPIGGVVDWPVNFRKTEMNTSLAQTHGEMLDGIIFFSAACCWRSLLPSASSYNGFQPNFARSLCSLFSSSKTLVMCLWDLSSLCWKFPLLPASSWDQESLHSVLGFTNLHRNVSAFLSSLCPHNEFLPKWSTQCHKVKSSLFAEPSWVAKQLRPLLNCNPKVIQFPRC